jgi:hypothetical protein
MEIFRLMMYESIALKIVQNFNTWNIDTKINRKPSGRCHLTSEQVQ